MAVAAWRLLDRQTAQDREARTVVGTLRTEPETFNRLVTASAAVDAITHLIHAPLIKVDRVTGALTPWLAERWDALGPASYRLHLREGVRFSDGAAFTSDDVVFTFRAVYDARVNSALASGLLVDGEPLVVTAEGPYVVRIDFPAAYGPGLAMLDALPILPRHRLEAALDAGRFAEAWAASAPPVEIAGLGPFAVEEVRAGESIAFTRNAHYFRRDADGASAVAADTGPLPRADRLIIRIIPDQSAEMIQLESGAADFGTSGLRAEDIAAFRALESQGRIRTHDVGVALDPNALWFNLKPGAPSAAERPWLQSRELRRAISHAVSRRRIIDTVFLGAAEPVVTPVTPGHGPWHAADVTPHAHDAAAAARLLEAAGLTDRDGNGIREDAGGREARFTLLTQRGHTIRERMASIIQDDLAKAGVAVDVVALEVGSLISRIGGGDYDAVLFGLQASAVDPALNLDFWLPSGVFHFWNPSQQRPSVAWEVRLASLMDRVVRATDQAERHRHFHDAQRLFAEELPAIYFAAPRVLLATSARLEGAIPTVLQPHILWQPERLRVK